MGLVDVEVGGDRDRRGGRDRLFVGDARDRDPARDTRPLGQQHPAENVEDAARDVAGEERLAPGDLGPADPDPVAEEAEDQVPAEGAERVVDREDYERRDQPEDVEMDALVLDLRPLVDDGEDEEAEYDQGEAELDRQPDPFALGRFRSEPGAGLADPVK